MERVRRIGEVRHEDLVVAIVGLGYVGLPLAVAFGKNRSVIGFDTSQERIDELSTGIDRTKEISQDLLFERSPNLRFSSDPNLLSEATCYIVTVPTPIDRAKNPDLTPMLNATSTIARYLKPNDIVIYESTVYPGATEEVCVPVLERITGLKFNIDFFCGYSPERINPGDKNHHIEDIVKIVSGSCSEVARIINDLYASIIKAGVYLAPSIKVAEAAKVIENTQRDVNIALMNELSIIFSRLGIDTADVLRAAETKWNFLRFEPGLVGGHCIGVDPYYLTHKAQISGYQPEIILSGRRLNDSFHNHIVSQIALTMSSKRISMQGSKILVAGLSFKENCPDTRNSKVFDLIEGLKNLGAQVYVIDPWISNSQKNSGGYTLIENIESEDKFDCIVLAVKHDVFYEWGIEKFAKVRASKSVFVDLKAMYPKHLSDLRL